MDKLAVHLEFGKILVIVAIISIILTSLMYFIFRKHSKYNLVKYIPGLIFTGLGVYNLLTIGISLPDTNEFNRVLMTLVFMVAGLIGIFTGLIIGVITKDKKTKKP